MSYKAMDVAKYILSYCTKKDQSISNLQLQKILYYVQVDFFQKTGDELFSDEFEAWQFGPVVPSVYWRYCGHGAAPIRALLMKKTIDDDDAKRIDPIIDEKSVLPPWDLVEETHKKGHAWDLTYKDGLGNKDIIKKELIRQCG